MLVVVLTAVLSGASGSPSVGALWEAWHASAWARERTSLRELLAQPAREPFAEAHRLHLLGRLGGAPRASEIGAPLTVRAGEVDGASALLDVRRDGGFDVGRWQGAPEGTRVWLEATLMLTRPQTIGLHFGADGPWRLSIDGRKALDGRASRGFDGESLGVRLTAGEHRVRLEGISDRSRFYLRATTSRGVPLSVWGSPPSTAAPEPTAWTMSAVRTPRDLLANDLERALFAQAGRPDEAKRAWSRLTLPSEGGCRWLPRLSEERRVEAVFACPTTTASDWLARGELAWDDGRLLEAESALQRALELAPTLPRARAQLAAFVHDRLGDRARALEIIGDSTQPGVLAELLRMTDALGAPERAKEIAENILSRDPTWPGVRAMAARSASQRGDVETLVALCREGARIEPTEPRWVLLEMRWRPDAAAHARLRFPLHPDVRAPGAPSRDPPGTQSWSQLSDLPASPEGRSAGAEVLLDRRRYDVRGRSWTKLRELVIRVLDPGRASAARTLEFEYAPGRESLDVRAAERWTAEGVALPALRVEDEAPSGMIDGMYLDARTRRVVFDTIESGDLIRVVIARRDLPTSTFGDFVGSIEPAQTGWPVRRFELVATADVDLRFSQRGLQPPKIDRAGDVLRASWVASDLPAASFEPLPPPYTEHAAFVSLSTHATWDDVAAWFAGLYADQLSASPEALEAGRRRTAGLQRDEDKVRALYALVVDRIRYVGIELGIHGWRPMRASETFERGYGDCKDKSTLLSSLLADHGITSHLVLVRTSDRGDFPSDAPTIWAFNHAILYVPSLQLYLDPTAERVPAGELPPADQGAFALVTQVDGTGKFVRLPTSDAEDNLNDAEYRAEIERDGAILIEGTETFSGHPATNARITFEERDERVVLLERALGQSLPGVQLERASFGELEDHERPVQYTFRARVPGHAQQSIDSLRLPISLHHFDMVATYAGLVSRETDVVLEHPWRTRNRVHYTLPVDAELAELPPPTTIETPHLIFRQRITRAQDGFVVEDDIIMPRRRVPQDAYAAFRQACLEVDAAMSREVSIRWR